MEHEVFVPVSAERLRQVLADPERVAGAVPGLQRDAEEAADPLSGRLKVRVGGHSITYRGAATVEPGSDGAYALRAEGAEVRGSGTVKLSLALRLVQGTEGTTLAFDGGATADGRITEGAPETVEAAMHRLLERFGEGLAAAAPPDTAPDEAAEADGIREADGTHEADEIDDGDEIDEDDDLDDLPDVGDADDVIAEAEAVDAENAESIDELDDLDDIDDIDDIDVPPAEAAHARRTMIGRSAEEVDHAPPRGRYAPAPAPESLTAGATLRWAAPAAALALASAIVVGRALRRRR
ncbi:MULTISPECIES: SRPBCC domain-containing protein [unclassified Streptomyces]|uniref:SRPBCC domain-containing protein n=1 Tax=unclassified Streptomyces TaxID=2593676 RepID=UPI0033E9DAA3